MRGGIQSKFALLLLGWTITTPAHGDLVDIDADNVNRLIFFTLIPSFEYTTFTDYFSTYNDGLGSNLQRSMVYTSGSTFHAALSSAVGGGAYTITSVNLTIGSKIKDGGGFGPYMSQGLKGAYEILTAYDPASVTWNNFNSGGVQGVNYANSALATGVINATAETTVWTFSPSLIQGWIDSPSTNLGLFFPDYGSPNDSQDTTPYYNVRWNVGVQAVPEPSTFALTGIGMGLAAVVRWRKRRAGPSAD